jgi:diaminopimelate decarboxylase
MLEWGTPLWVVSRSMVESSFRSFLDAMRSRYANCEVAYSIKANNTLAVIRLLHQAGAKMDCSAEYEFQLALDAGVPASDIILNGNGKSENALRQAASLGVREVNVDSLDEVHRLNEVAHELDVHVPCTVRVQLTYDKLLAADPSYEPTLRLIDKAGNSLRSGQALAAIDAVVAASHLDFVGLHHHKVFSGYSAPDYAPENEIMHHRECTRELCALANEIKARHGIEVERLNLGGGFRTNGSMLRVTPGGVDDGYFAYPTAEGYAEAIFGTIEEVLDTTNYPLVQFETGGKQIQDAVLMLSSVSEIKDASDVRTEQARRFVTIDASAMMFVLRSTQGSVPGYPIVVADNAYSVADPDTRVDVVGQSCMPDTIAEDIRLPVVRAGDVLALLNQGAYAETMSTQMNGFPRPAVVLVDNGRAYLVKRRETIEDISSRNIIPPELAATAPTTQTADAAEA